MLAGAERERLLRVASELDVELGYPPAPRRVDGDGTRAAQTIERVFSGMLDDEDEGLVETVRSGLARLAAAISVAHPPVGRPSAIEAALDGAEIMMRGEIVTGNSERLPALVPGFVFLVTLPMVGEAEALQLSRRVAKLLDETGES